MQLPGMLALELLSALVAADSASADSCSTVLAICQTGLPDSMLHDVAACASAISQQVSEAKQQSEKWPMMDCNVDC